MPSEYQHLCNPLRLTDDAETFQLFWRQFAKDYQNRNPHSGYSILESWCNGKIQGLKAEEGGRKSEVSSWWIYSSNVDGHFHRFDAFKNTICEIHGRASELRCSRAICYNNKDKRIGAQWAKWNDSVNNDRNVECNGTILLAQDFFDQCKMSLMQCKNCGLPLRPNVLMFHDTDENVLSDIEIERRRYQNWEEIVEKAVVDDDFNLVILELGCGTSVPAVREESEEVFKDCVERIKKNKKSEGNVTLIRVNPKDFSFEFSSEKYDCSLISIAEGAEKALQYIDAYLTLLR